MTRGRKIYLDWGDRIIGLEVFLKPDESDYEFSTSAGLMTGKANWALQYLCMTS